MANEKQLLEMFGKIEGDVNGVIATAVVDLESGMTLAAKSNRSDFDLAVASAYNSELVKQKMKTMKSLGLTDSIEDILITLTKAYHIIRPVQAKSGIFIYLVLDRAKANLAMARRACQDCESSLSF